MASTFLPEVISKPRTQFSGADEEAWYHWLCQVLATVQLPAGHRVPPGPVTQNSQVVPFGMPVTLASSFVPPGWAAYLTASPMCVAESVIWSLCQCTATGASAACMDTVAAVDAASTTAAAAARPRHLRTRRWCATLARTGARVASSTCSAGMVRSE